MPNVQDVDPLSDGAGAKDGIEPFGGSFADDGLTKIQAMSDDEFCRARMLRQQRAEKAEQRRRFSLLLQRVVRLH